MRQICLVNSTARVLVEGVGVYRGKYRARIMFNGKDIFLGNFTNKETAAKAYDEAATKYFGEFAVLNFPEERRQ